MENGNPLALILILLTIGLQGYTIWANAGFKNAMALAQIDVLKAVGGVSNDVGNIKTDVHRELSSFAAEGASFGL
jgi:hypothetical protein